MNDWFLLWLCFCGVFVLGLISNIAGNIKRIADKLDLRDSNWAKGYRQGCEDTKMVYGIEDGDT